MSFDMHLGAHPHMTRTSIIGLAAKRPKMIRKAKEKEPAQYGTGGGRLRKPALEAEAFDAVINSQSFHHYPNPDAFFAYEMLQGESTIP